MYGIHFVEILETFDVLGCVALEVHLDLDRARVDVWSFLDEVMKPEIVVE